MTKVATKGYDLPRNPRKPQLVSREWLQAQYVGHGPTLTDLAHDKGMSAANMHRQAQDLGIALRPRGGTSHSDALQAKVLATAVPEILRPALTGANAWERLARFAAAAEYPTLSAAAAELRIRPTVLVTQVLRVERELGGPLRTRFQRGRPMQLTPLGVKAIAAIRETSPSKGTARVRPSAEDSG
ncbi:helix-turn-helix domain-containing protein [Streptomyces sp. 8N706]|uniref:helix-turn-helix domain-containing protein n=1 Tax=Streptomyces sp. 8N706 TaxID=3457416 RepID=UPI003FD5FE62